MEDTIFEPFKLKLETMVSSVLADKAENYDIEQRFPAMLNKEKLKKMLGCGSDEVERYINAKNFPIVKQKGKQDRFPRDAVRDYLRYNWMNIV